MLFQTLATVASASLASAAAIHLDTRATITDFDKSPVQFTFPPGRGFVASTASDAPCGGLKPSSPRTPFPLLGGDVALTQRTSIDNLNIMWTKDADPSRFHAFSSYTNTIADISEGHFCTKAPDFSSLGFKEGDDATLLLAYQLDGEGKYYYHCADVNLVASSGFKTDAVYTCGNYTTELNIASSEDSLKYDATKSTGSVGTTSSNGDPHAGVSGAPSLTSTKSSGLSNAAAGGIGAGVTIGVFALGLAALWALGLARFGKKQAVTLDSASDHSQSTANSVARMKEAQH